MDSLMVGLLVSLLIGQVLLAVCIGTVAWLCYRTLVRPEAPCFAAALHNQQRGMMQMIDSSHPAYSALAKKLASENKTEKSEGGTYL